MSAKLLRSNISNIMIITQTNSANTYSCCISVYDNTAVHSICCSCISVYAANLGLTKILNMLNMQYKTKTPLSVLQINHSPHKGNVPDHAAVFPSYSSLSHLTVYEVGFK